MIIKYADGLVVEWTNIEARRIHEIKSRAEWPRVFRQSIDRDLVAKLHNEGKNQTQIADACDTRQSVISRILRTMELI